MPTSALGYELQLVQPWCNQQGDALLRSRRPIVRTRGCCVRILYMAFAHCILRIAILLLLRDVRELVVVLLLVRRTIWFALAVGKLCPVDERANWHGWID